MKYLYNENIKYLKKNITIPENGKTSFLILFAKTRVPSQSFVDILVTVNPDG